MGSAILTIDSFSAESVVFGSVCAAGCGRFFFIDFLLLDLPLDFLNLFEKSEIKTLYTLWQKSLNSPLTSSFGRLFDAVCSLANILHIQEFEGQTGLYIENLYDENIKEFFSYDIVDQTIDISKMIESNSDLKYKRITEEAAKNTTVYKDIGLGISKIYFSSININHERILNYQRTWKWKLWASLESC